MKQYLLYIALLIASSGLYAQQNLVLNPSFENNQQNKKGITDIKKGVKLLRIGHLQPQDILFYLVCLEKVSRLLLKEEVQLDWS